MTIRDKLVVTIATVAALAAGLTSVLNYRTAVSSLEERAFERLTAVREMKAEQIESYFEQVSAELVVASQDRSMAMALRELSLGAREAAEADDPDSKSSLQGLKGYYQDVFFPRLKAAGTEPSIDEYFPRSKSALRLQRAYLSDNGFKPGSKHLLDASEAGLAYDVAHARYHPHLRTYLERYGFYDVFLIEPEEGRIVYSVFKEADFGTSLRHGPYRDTGLARAFVRASEAKTPGFVTLEDFSRYAPSYGAPAAFMAAPVFADGELVGVIAVQLSIDRINSIMTHRGRWRTTGLGETGETYIVGDDRLLRSESRFLLEDKEAFLKQLAGTKTGANVAAQIERVGSGVGLQLVESEAAGAALQGERGTRYVTDYRGMRVLSAYRPLELHGVNWVILSEVDEDEAFADAKRLRRDAFLVALLLIAGALVVSLLVARRMTGRLRDLAVRAAAMAKGDLETPLEASGRDEITELAQSFDAMRVALREHMEAQERSIEALATPIIALAEDVVALPLVGEMDVARVDAVRTRLISSLEKGKARVAVLDITGVRNMAPDVAAALARVAVAARLVGTRVIVSGMQPAVAQTLADLNLDLGAIHAERDMGAAVQLARRWGADREAA